jgi:hypothetical protein
VFSGVPELASLSHRKAAVDIEADGFVFSGLTDLSKVENCDVLAADQL